MDVPNQIDSVFHISERKGVPTMHSRLPKMGTAVGVMAGLIASSLAVVPVASAAEEETAGNNLAFPVLWSEADYTLPLQGVMGEPTVDGVLADCSEETVDATEEAAVQKDLGNTWQAENLVESGNSVSSLDWGDNLEVKDWNVGPPVRVETALYADRTGDPMTGYLMCHVSGKGTDEVWGAQVATEMGGMGGGGQSLIEYDSTEALVYTAGARLTIQRIDEGATPTWDAAQHRWVGTGVADPEFNGAVHEKTSDGPGTYGAEVNVSGKIVFGFNWQTAGLYNGEYRITFSLDGPTDTFPGSGTSLANATIRQSVEEVAGDELAIRSSSMAGPGAGGGGGHGGGMGGGSGGGSGGEGGGNTAVMDGANNLSYIDVALTGGEDPPVVPDPEPTNPPAPPSGDTGTSAPPAADPGAGTTPGGANPDAGQPGAGVPVEVASPVQAQQRIRQRAQIQAPKSSKQRVRTRLVLTREPVFTDQGVTVRWRVTKRSEDNCTIRNRDGRVTVKFTKRGRCTVVAWAPSPNPLVYAPFNEKRIYKVRNTL